MNQEEHDQKKDNEDQSQDQIKGINPNNQLKDLKELAYGTVAKSWKSKQGTFKKSYKQQERNSKINKEPPNS